MCHDVTAETCHQALAVRNHFCAKLSTATAPGPRAAGRWLVGEVALSAGTIEYEDSGGAGRCMSSSTERRWMGRCGHRWSLTCGVTTGVSLPTLPLGAHRRPMHRGGRLHRPQCRVGRPARYDPHPDQPLEPHLLRLRL